MGLQPNRLYERMLSRAQRNAARFRSVNEKARYVSLPYDVVLRDFWNEGYPRKRAEYWIREWESMDIAAVGYIEGDRWVSFFLGGRYEE